MNLQDLTVPQFVDESFSKAPVPGGGGVAAVVGALGAALGGMVCNLTTGKKKYAKYEEDIQRLLNQLDTLTKDILSLAEQDAENFAPLAACYSLPAETESQKKEKHDRIQAALLVAISAPIQLVKLSYETLLCLEELVQKGSVMVLSDVGCGALCLKAALQMGWLNVKINLSSIEDTAYCTSVRAELLPLLQKGEALADHIYQDVEEKV